MDKSTAEYRIKQLEKMLDHEASKTEEHYGAHLMHWYGDSKAINIGADEIRLLIRYYKKFLRV